MEAAGGAQICRDNNINFAVIKTIADRACEDKDHDDSEDYKKMLASSSSIAAEIMGALL